MQDFLFYACGSLVFLLSLTMGELLFSHGYGRRSCFAVRYVASRVLVLAASYIPTLFYFLVEKAIQNAIVTNCAVIVAYLMMFSMLVLSMAFSYNASFLRCLVSAALSYLCQNISYGIYFILNTVVGLDRVLYMNMPVSAALAVSCLLQLACTAVVLASCYVLFAHRMSGFPNEQLSWRSTAAIVVIILLFVLVFNALGNILNAGSTPVNVFVRVLLILCCVGILALYVILLKEQSAEREAAILSKLNEDERRHYDNLKETMQLIDIKCHDIKHYIAAAGNGDRAVLDELSESVAIYDTTVKTGNEVIDTLIAERALFCSAHDIRLTVIADASGLSFISAGDMCALFGNMIENAVEAVMQVEEEKRLINVNIYPVAGQVFFSVENCCSRLPVIQDGLPKTSKQDTAYHGYGMKSIRMIAEKYGGTFSFSAQEGLFRVTVLFPLPQ